MGLRITGLDSGYGQKQILHGIDIDELEKGQLTVLLGPNASGKSSLFKAVAGLLPIQSGQIEYDGLVVNELSRQDRFKHICYLPQSPASNINLTVYESILLSHKQNQRWLVHEEDHMQCDKWIQRLNISHLSNLQLGELSGGQQQLVSICQALVRESNIYLFDEPTSALDIRRALQILHLLKKETIERNLVTVVAMHDLTLASQLADHIVLMSDGKVHASGMTQEIFGSGAIDAVFGVKTELLQSQAGSLTVAVTQQ